MGILKGISNAVEGVGSVIKGSGKAVEGVGQATVDCLQSESAKRCGKLIGETAVDMAEEVIDVLGSIWQWIRKNAEAILKTITRFAVATLEIVADWFKKVQINKEEDVAFTLTECLRNREYQVIQGVFSKVDNDVKNFRTIHSENISDELNTETILLYS